MAASPADKCKTASVDGVAYPTDPINLLKWCKDHADAIAARGFLPLTGRGTQFRLYVVSPSCPQFNGFFIDTCQKWFWQLEGCAVVKTLENGVLCQTDLQSGDCFLLEKQVPHRVERHVGAYGLEIMLQKAEGEMDSAIWLAENGQVEHTKSFHVSAKLDIYEMLAKLEEEWGVARSAAAGAAPVSAAEASAQLQYPAVYKLVFPSPPSSGIYGPPVNLVNWIEANKQNFVPPVGNKMIYDQPTRFWDVMCVGGPNSRTDYHIEAGEEFFYMVKGDMVLKIHDSKAGFRDIVIREGEFWLLPPYVPHSPQRIANTVGLVLERKRADNELDAVRWYCRSCRDVVQHTEFHCGPEGLVSDLKREILRYYADESVPLRTCRSCGVVDKRP